MPKTLPKLSDLPDVRGKYVLVRAGLNVPLVNGVVSNQFRIVRALPTINTLRAAGARVVVAAHIGRDTTDTLAPVYTTLKEHIPVTWAGGVTGDIVTGARNAMKDGDVLLLENVRSDEREKKNDPTFAAELAALADYYVNDAFSASHREHTSLCAVASLLPAFFGHNFMHEFVELEKARTPKAPGLFILGGAKFDTKMPLVELFIEHYDHVFVGGALANDFFKARGLEVGTSLVSDIDLSSSPLLTHSKILTPVDVVVAKGGARRVCAPEEVTPEESILDAGPATVEMLKEHVVNAKTILWNGPLGNFEAGYGEYTKSLACEIAASSAYAIVGGGDTIAAIESLDCQESYGFMSTAGGAMLTYLEKGTLPAIDVVVGG